MKTSITRRRPAPGTVLGLAALVIALAGTAIAGPLSPQTAFKLDKNEKRQVRKIARKEIKAAAPNLSVRHAATADEANQAANADNADTVDGHDAACPTGTFLQGGTCFDTAVRFPMTPWSGATDCADAGGRLPSVTELLSIRNVAGIDLGPSGDGHWADITYDDGATEEAAMVRDNGAVDFAPVGNQNQLRCAFDLVR